MGVSVSGGWLVHLLLPVQWYVLGTEIAGPYAMHTLIFSLHCIEQCIFSNKIEKHILSKKYMYSLFHEVHTFMLTLTTCQIALQEAPTY